MRFLRFRIPSGDTEVAESLLGNHQEGTGLNGRALVFLVLPSVAVPRPGSNFQKMATACEHRLRGHYALFVSSDFTRTVIAVVPRHTPFRVE